MTDTPESTIAPMPAESSAASKAMQVYPVRMPSTLIMLVQSHAAARGKTASEIIRQCIMLALVGRAE